MPETDFTISYRNRITNNEVRQRMQKTLLSNRVREKRLKWLGHMLRMKEKSPEEFLSGNQVEKV